MQNKKCLGIIDLVNEKSLCYYNKGDLIIEQGKKTDTILYIEKGSAKIIHTNTKGKEFTFLHVYNGAYLGIHPLLNKENSFVSVIATERLIAYKITKESLEISREEKTEISIELIKLLCSTIGLVETKIAKIFQKNIKEQVAEILLSNIKCEITADQSIIYSINELADLVGTTKNYIYKILSELQQLQLISIKDKKVQVSDKKKLTLFVQNMNV